MSDLNTWNYLTACELFLLSHLKLKLFIKDNYYQQCGSWHILNLSDYDSSERDKLILFRGLDVCMSPRSYNKTDKITTFAEF